MSPSFKTIEVHRAGSIGSRHVPTLSIYATVEVADDLSVEEAIAQHERESEQIVDALMQCLPGGVVDRVMVKLMARHVSAFIVAHDRLKAAVVEATPSQVPS